MHGLPVRTAGPPAARMRAVTLSRPDVLRLLEENGISPSRALGQNFVADPNTVRRIARLAGVGPGDRVVEIGAGLGSLTLALLETGATVTAVERDRWLVPVLRKVLAGTRPSAPVQVVEADAMHLDWAGAAGTGPRLGAGGQPALQRRHAAGGRPAGRRAGGRADAGHGPGRGGPPPGGPGRRASYGAVSVKVAYWAEAALVGTVPSSVFVPRPEGRFRSRQPQAPACPWRRPPPRRARGAVRLVQDRVRPTPEDAAAGVGRVWACRRQCLPRRASTTGRGRRSCRWLTGAGWRQP